MTEPIDGRPPDAYAAPTMTEFVEEVRSRVVRLLQMANTTDDRLRKQIIAYADATPEPPLMGADGIGTTGCPRCRRTMWQQRDAEGPVWVCAFCGHVEAVATRTHEGSGA